MLGGHQEAGAHPLHSQRWMPAVVNICGRGIFASYLDP